MPRWMAGFSFSVLLRIYSEVLIMKLNVRRSVINRSVVIAAALITTGLSVPHYLSAQTIRFGLQNRNDYSLFGQGRYGANSQYGQGNVRHYGYGTTTRGYGHDYHNHYGRHSGGYYGYRNSPYVRTYGGTSYYQPYTYNRGLYFGFGNH